VKSSLQPWQLLFLVFAGWVNRRQPDVIGYLRTENRILRDKLGKKYVLMDRDGKFSEGHTRDRRSFCYRQPSSAVRQGSRPLTRRTPTRSCCRHRPRTRAEVVPDARSRGRETMQTIRSVLSPMWTGRPLVGCGQSWGTARTWSVAVQLRLPTDLHWRRTGRYEPIGVRFSSLRGDRNRFTHRVPGLTGESKRESVHCYCLRIGGDIFSEASARVNGCRIRCRESMGLSATVTIGICVQLRATVD